MAKPKKETKKAAPIKEEFEPPVITAISMHKVETPVDSYQVCIYKLQGDKVVSRENYGTPNLRKIAESNFKKAVVFKLFEPQLEKARKI